MKKPLDEVKEIIQKHKKELKEKYGVKEISIFGSLVREEAREDSDVDILVEFEKPTHTETLTGHLVIYSGN